MMEMTFTAKTSPDCQEFLKIIENGQQYKIEEFFEKHKNDNILEFDNAVNASSILYRDVEKKYTDILDEQLAFSETLPFFEIQPLYKLEWRLVENSDRSAVAFVKNAASCLQNARYFIMLSASMLESNENIRWQSGYVSHFGLRTIKFSTAINWLSSCFDQILQVAYWGYDLYTSAKHEKIPYDDSWDIERTLKCCNPFFVKKELEAKGLTDVKTLFTDCEEKVQKVRDWANYIKHKGGIDYQHLKAPPPFKVTIEMDDAPGFTSIDEYVSPVSIDIDNEIITLTSAHAALFHCLTEVVKSIDFNNRAVQII